MKWGKLWQIDERGCYRCAVGMALLGHLFLLAGFMVMSQHIKPRAMASVVSPPIIQAMVVSQMQLNQIKTIAPSPSKIERSPQLTKTKPLLDIKPILQSPITWPEKQASRLPPVKKTPIPPPVKKILPKPTIKKRLTSQSKPSSQIEHKDRHNQSKPSIKKVAPPKAMPPASLKMVQKNVQQLLQQEMHHLAQQQKIAQQNAAITDKYRQLILQSIAQRWIVPPELNPHLETKLQIQLAPGGMVLAVKIVKSSGNSILDRSAQAAVYKASPLPVPKNNALFNTFQYINLTVRPEGMLTPS